MHHAGNGKHGVGAVENGFDDIAHGGSDSVESSALTRNNSRARLADVFLDLGNIDLSGEYIVSLHFFLIVLYVHAGYAGKRPGREAGIAVLAEHIGVDIANLESAVLGDTRAQSCRVDDRARTDNAVFGDTRQTAERVRKNIDGVGYHYVNGVGGVLRDHGDNGLLDRDVGVDEFQS